LNRVIPLLVFSILLLVPVGVQNAFAGNEDVLNSDISNPSASRILVVTTSDNEPNTKTSSASCPATDQVIGGGKLHFLQFALTTPDRWLVKESVNLSTNSYDVTVTVLENSRIEFQAFAICSGITTLLNQMGSMIGGALMDIDSMSLLVGAIGVNPIITGLVAITMGGVAAQAIWFVNRRRVKKVE